MAELGPDAPTLCAGWDNRAMAAHLVARENQPEALAGIVVPRLHHRTERIEKQTAERYDFDTLLHKLAGGPPLGPVGLPGVADPANVHEFFVHHEDVRRAQPGWERRELPEVLRAALWRRLLLLSPVFFRRVRGVKLRLETPDGAHSRTVGFGGGHATLIGDVPELFLYAFGRREVADVTVAGDPQAREKVETARLGV